MTYPTPQPGYPTPLAYGSPYGYSPPRSSAPKVLGIIGIIYGALGALVQLAFTLIAVGASAGGLVPDLSRTYLAAEIAQHICFALLGILLVVGSIGLLGYKRWGASALTIWAWIAIAGLILWTIVALATSEPPAPPPDAPPGFEAGQKIGFYAGAACVNLVRAILPIVFLAMLRRQDVRQSLT